MEVRDVQRSLESRESCVSRESKFGESQSESPEHQPSVSHTRLTSLDSSLPNLHGLGFGGQQPQPQGQLVQQPLRQSRSAGSIVALMTPEMKLRMQRLLRQNAGVLRQDASSILLGAYNMQRPEIVSDKEIDKRLSAVAIEMLREQEDRDLHPYGRGGRFEGVLYSRRVKVQVDHAKFLAWIVFAGFILLTSGAIIFLAEMERRQKSQQLQVAARNPTLLATGNGTAAAAI